MKEQNGEPIAITRNPTQDARLQGQLARYLKEALAREACLDKKLKELQALVQVAVKSSESAWQASVDEERLLARLEMVEEQLKIYRGHLDEDDFRNELVRLKEEQMHANLEGKDSLCHALEEKTRALVRMDDLERRLTSTEEECERLRQLCQETEDELIETSEKFNTKLDEIVDLKKQLEQEEGKCDETVKRLEAEKTNLIEKLEQATQNETELSARLSAFLQQQESGEFVDENRENLASTVRKSSDERQNSTEKINELENKLEEGSKSVASLQSELENSQAEAAAHLARIATLEGILISGFFKVFFYFINRLIL